MYLHSSPTTLLRRFGILTLTALAFLAFLPHSVTAQSLSYTTVTRGEFGGSMGQMMQMVPGAQDPSRETTFIKGTLMRSDGDETSTITDLAEGRLTYLQHDERTWYSFSMEEMAEQMEGAGAGAGMNPYQQPEAPAGQGAEPRFEMKFSTERTGRTETFDGYSADEVFMLIEMVPREEAMEEGEEFGTTVIFTQLWMSTDFPEYAALEAARDQMAQKFMAGRGGDISASFQAAFAQDPKMQEAFEQSSKEMEAMDGIAVRTVTSFVMVPQGMEFDREAVIAGLDQPLSAGGGNLAAQAAGAAAAGAAREALGRMSGMFGRRNRQQPQEEAESPTATQTIIMRMSSAIEDVRTDTLSDDLFQPPADYRKIEPGFGQG